MARTRTRKAKYGNTKKATKPGQIEEALSSFGLTAEVAYANAARKTAAWADLQAFVRDYHYCAVYVDG